MPFIPIPKAFTDSMSNAESRYRVEKSAKFLTLRREYLANGKWLPALDGPIKIPRCISAELIEHLE